MNKILNNIGDIAGAIILFAVVGYGAAVLAVMVAAGLGWR